MKKQGIFFITIGIVLIFFLTGCYVFHQIGWMDSLVLQFLEMIRSDTMHSIMLFFTNVFYGPIYFLLISIVVIWLWITKHRKEAFYFVLVLILGNLLILGMKQLFLRDRPALPLIPIDGYSFPSAHTYNAVIFYGFLLYLVKRYISVKSLRYLISIVLVFFIILTAISRLYLQVHYFTDIIGGFALGFLTFGIFLLIVDKEKSKPVTSSGDGKSDLSW